MIVGFRVNNNGDWGVEVIRTGDNWEGGNLDDVLSSEVTNCVEDELTQLWYNKVV